MMIDLNPVIFKAQLWLGAENKDKFHTGSNNYLYNDKRIK